MSETDSPVASVTYRLLKSGKMAYQAEGTFSPHDLGVVTRFFASTATKAIEPLVQITATLPDPLLSNLIREINVAYSYQLFTSTWVCLRKLFENLIIELLRKRFGTSTRKNVSLFYWIGQRKFNDFSVLIENFESKATDFDPYTSGFNQDFFDFLKKFKRRANRNAHSIDVLSDVSKIEDIKSNLNNCITLLCSVIERINRA